MNDTFQTYARGKLLLTGEYFVLDGALALALPVRYGQCLRVEPWREPGRLSWISKNDDGSPWFLAEFEVPSLELLSATDRRVAANLQQILRQCQQQNPAFLSTAAGFKALTQSDFHRTWGLGTSSTLVAAVSRWAAVNPYQVLAETFGGSGYDIACAYAEGPVLYQLEHGQPTVRPADFQPNFTDCLHFVSLGRKQDSREGIRRFRERAGKDDAGLRAEISKMTLDCLACKTLPEFEAILCRHEQCIGTALDLPTVKSVHFQDYWGTVKSLGAWGGDFVLATSDRAAGETRAYFTEKGFETVLGWKEMVL